jgi:hypothetical protein
MVEVIPSPNTTGVRGNKKGQKAEGVFLRPIGHGTLGDERELNPTVPYVRCGQPCICILAFFNFVYACSVEFYVPCVGLSTAQTQIFDGTLKKDSTDVDSIQVIRSPSR